MKGWNSFRKKKTGNLFKIISKHLNTLRQTVFGTFNFINELKFILLKASRKMQTRIKIKKKTYVNNLKYNREFEP